jgi:hypothetical protein
MSTEVTLDILHRWGDTLERAICDERHGGSEESSDLIQILYPYSGIWHDHILPRRDQYDLSRLDDKHLNWVSFSADHYTALVKLYHAFRKYRHLINCCKRAEAGELFADLLLDAHDSIAGFWEHMGSAIDNLGRCFDDAPGLNYSDGDGLKSIQSKYEYLSFAFNRRTQMIHHSLVPIGFEDGAIIFNERHFDKQETEWNTLRYTPEWVAEYYVKRWKSVLAELASVWNRLRSELKKADPSPPSVPEVLKDPERKLKDGRETFIGSGLRRVIQSNSCRKASGVGKKEPYWIRAVAQASSGSAYLGTGGSYLGMRRPAGGSGGV